MLKDLLINHLAPGEIDRTGERVDGMATIIGKLGYNWIAVLDAKYRTANTLWSTLSPIDISGLIRTNTEHLSLLSNLSPSEILAQPWADIKTSGANSVAVTQAFNSTGAPAVHQAIISGTQYTSVLPNIQTLAFVSTKINFVDLHDPTAASYPDNTLSQSTLRTWWSSSLASASSVAVCSVINKGSTITSRISFADYKHAADTLIVPVFEIPAYEDRTGERIDGKATIIGRLDENWIAVLDAAYRGIAMYSNVSQDTSAGIPALAGSYTIQTDLTENEILAQQLYDPHSSKWNTDYLTQATVGANYYAAKMCHDITIDGKHAQLGNVQTMAFVFANRAFVDENDPTAGNNKVKKLSNWGFGSTGSRKSVLTSSSIGYQKGIIEIYEGVSSGYTQTLDVQTYAGVCPILEIPLYKDRTRERVDDKATIVGKLGNYWIAVLDETYKDSGQWGTYGQALNGLKGTSGSVQAYIGWTEAAILSQSSKDPMTSKQNTDWLKANKESYFSPAAEKCYSIPINGTNAQLPNIQTAIFAAASLPDVVPANLWTSTKFIDSNSEVYYVAVGAPSVQSAPIIKTSVVFTSPILEIPLWCDDDYK